ncbi:type II toxin-antitoxin system death-on-curing family toxin [bacterium]|nr:type II toxin-antitoxin system death-on-curing family toxin [bacterium]
MAVKFLPLELVKLIHANQIHRYGGLPGIRDHGLLESALAQPKMSAGGRLIHKNIFEQAAAYGFHLCKNHPFVDGNKRTAFVSMYVFLFNNAYEIVATEGEAYLAMMKLANGRLSKNEVVSWLKKNCRKIKK